MEEYKYIIKVQDVTHRSQANLGQLVFNIGERDKFSYEEYVEFMKLLEKALEEISSTFKPKKTD